MTSSGRGNARFTVVTSTFNCAKALEQTAQSIRDQNYPNIQWIVIDGASDDGTLEVIRNNSDIISNWQSEPDAGIYDAWNKSANLINGDWVLFMGAGDRFYSNDVLSTLGAKLSDIPPDCVLFYGNVQIEKPDGTPRYLSRKPDLDYWEFGRPALPHHQGVFSHSSLFKQKRPFDSSYRIAGDSKFLLGALQHTTAFHIDITVARMVDDGVSNTYQHILFTQDEIVRLCGELCITVPFSQRILSTMNRFLYYIAYRFLPGPVSKRVQKTMDRLRRITSGATK